MKFFFQNNITYTRGALLALFAGLFILAACGGGGVTIAPTIIVTDPPEDSPCVTNPFGPTCTPEQKVAVIDLCRAAIARGDDCVDNTPEAVVSCLTDPFSAACITAQATENPFEGTEITIAKEQEKRQAACLRSDTTAVCGTAVSRLCSANPFTQTTDGTPTNLCVDIRGTAYDDARDNACLEQGAAGAGVGNDCNTRENVRLLCDKNPFTRPTVNTGVELCNDTNVGTSEADSAARTRICTTADAGSFRDECNSGAYGDEDTARDTYCKTSAQPDDSNCDTSGRTAGICTTSGGSTPFAPLCGTDTAAQLAACKGDLNTLPASGTSCATVGLSGVICGNDDTETGSNPFAPICGSSTQNSNFANLDTVQELDCRTNGNAGDGMDGGKCYTIKDKFCDGADVGDNPYATVCGNNSVAQETFCTNHGTTGSTNIGLCTNSLAILCPSDPFRNSGGVDCLGNGLYANQRADQCSKNTQGSGDCDTTTISDAVCIPSGTYANPFAAFCADGTDERTDTTTMTIAEVRQAVYTACLGNSDTGVCANTVSARDTLRTETCIVGNPTALFGSQCNYTEFESVEVDYCENPETTWDNAACDNEADYGDTKTTRNNACLDYGIGADGDASCENRKNVRSACSKNLFMKTRQGTPTDLCIGTDATGRLYSDIRTQICTTPTVRSFHESCNGGAYGDEVVARDNYCTNHATVGDAKCQEEGLTDKFCGTTGAEINVFATVCTDARRVTYCRLNVANPSCADTITTFCNSASDTDLFAPICNTGTLKANFNDYRVAACSATDERTGVYIACTGILNTHCNIGNSPACPPVMGTLPASVWVASARNANDTARLNILDEVGLDDAYTNYVQGGENGLNLTTVISKADGTIIDSDFDNVIDVIFDGDVLSLSDFDHLDESDNLSGGVAFAFIDVFNLFEEEKSFTDNALGRVDTRGRYYAGLLSGTDLGGPLTSVDGTAIWDARFAGYLSAADGVVFDDETSLLINFGTKEINTRDTADAVDTLGGVDINNNFISAGIISIDGEFTDAGVIYGISSWTALTKTKSEAIATPKTAHGTVTGLIGKYGAVGAFVSSGENDGIFEYAGGFVAAPVDCTQTGTPFHRLCNARDPAVIMARNSACLDYGIGDGGDASCANRANVRDACDKDVYKKTGNDNSVLLCTGTSDDVALGSAAYSALRTECEKSDSGSFAEYCDTQDGTGKVKNARDEYCRDVAPAMDANCGVASGHLDRITTFCAEGTGTSVFSGVCGTDTAAQLAACKGDLNTLPASGTSCATVGLSGVICGNDDTETGSNPFAPICGSSTQNSNFANLDTVQELDCRTNGNAGDGMDGGKCYTIKDKFCDGADVGDNPYATVCGNNSVAQETFCTNHGTTGSTNIGLCTNSLAILCPSDPFRSDGTAECLSNGLYANQRADQCSKNTQGSGDCDTTTISDAVCIPSGTYANPFAAFCADGTDERTDTTTMTIAEVRQAVYTACLGNSDTGVCANTVSARDTLRDTDCIATNPDKLFADGCDYTQFRDVEADYCDDEAKTWEDRCDDVMSETLVETARNNACLADGTNSTDGNGDADCADRANVRDACDKDVYKKIGSDQNVLLCTGTSDDVALDSAAYSALRTECEKSDSGSFAAYCDTQDNDGKVKTARDEYCRDVAPASDTANCGAASGHLDRITTFCAEGSGTSIFSDVCTDTFTQAQLTACKGEISDLVNRGAVAGNCNDDKLSGDICGRGTTPGSNPFAEICSDGDAIRTGFMKDKAQDAYCRASTTAQEGLTDGVCYTIKDKFCDGADVGDNPYATVCGNNSVAQETFCTNHGTTGSTNIGLCTNSLAILCPSDPFRNSGGVDCLGNGLYANQRADQCSKNTQGSGDCDTTTISDAVCIPSGTYANPFAAFCADGTDERTDTTTMTIAEVRQAVYTACLGNSDTGVCANTVSARDTLRTETCIVGNPTALFGSQCNYTEFESVEVDYCENPATTWDNTACDNEADYGDTKTTRNNACLDYGIGADGDASCENRKNVRSACSKNLFMKTRQGTPTDLCIGTDATGRLYSDIRTQICTTPTVRSFHESCNGGAYGDEVVARDNYCTDNALVGDAKCQEEGLTAKFCGTTGSEINVFATVCTDARRVTYCRLNVANPSCADTITTFCNSASDTDLFSPICNTGDLAVNFNDYRVAACSATDERTGAYSTCTDVLNMYCHETGTRSPSCAPVVVDTLPASVWVASARNANDTARLNVLDEVGLDDAYTNYVQGGENGLNLTSVISKADGTIIDSDFDNVIDVIFEGDVLSLSDFDHLDESDALSGGVAFAFIDVFNLFEEEKSFTDNAFGRVDTRGRYYAGLLSGTDLGGPLTSVDGTAIWDARFAGYLSAADGVVFDDETSLLINFGTKEINTRDTADAVDMFGGVDINNNFISAGIISIDGEFTDAGVIFGISSWTALTKTKSEATATPKTAHGTLTGLIGKYGAVGAFVSSGTNDGIFEYAGGFVAAPVDCRQTGIPFHRLCTNNLATQRDFCRADKDNELCPMTIANFCNDSANDIFDSLCSDDAGTYDFARGRQCVANGTTGGDCGDEDSGYIQDYCDTAAGLTNVTHCPKKYAGANPVNRDTDVVDVADFTGKALNAEGTGLETVVDNRGANLATDDRANFIVGGESDVKLGINRASKKTIRLNPDAGDQTDEYKSGFAIARAINTDYQNYYYVGLLSGTNVGALLPNANETTTLEWSAKLTILLGASFAPEQTFTLLVELFGRTIGVKPGSAPSGTLGFSINGKFTKNGLLYGRFASNLGGAGTLTGLIGQKGAVGIFKSNPNSTPYVGGFVATASINCTAVGTPFHVDCTDNADVQAKSCIANNAAAMVDFNANCRDNPEVQARVCEFGGSHVNVFNRDVCADGASDFRRVRVCFRRTNAFHIFGSFGGFNGAMDCVGDPVIKAEICRANGQYANPFDTVICPDSDNESVAVRAGLCSNHSIKPVADFDTNCLSGAITSLVCRASGANANPFDKSICPDDTATTNSNNIVRAQACSDRAMTPLPNGVNVGADCARDTAVTDIICTSSGANANPFDRDICTSDDMTTIGEGDEEKTVLTITIAQSAFVKNCRADNAEGSSTTTAGGADCSRYTDCAENPYQVTCDADNYHVERANYANQFVESCLGVAGVDAPVGAPDSCADELAQATICASSGEYANPFNTEICPDGYEDIAAIQSEFATMCYNTRTDLRNNPECENIATCFASGKLGVASATSTTGGIACDSAAFRGVVALENTLAACDGQVSGQTLTGTCVQETITKACNANPFSEIVNSKGIDCLSDTALNDRREGVCINDDTNPAYNCSATTTRVCVTDNNPFSDLCYDNATYEQARYDTCDGISGDITPNTVRTNEDNTLQNCLDTIDYECQYSETEQFTNRFCKIGTLYDAERGRVCLYGHTDVDKDNVIIPTPAECTDDTIYATAYCSDLAPEADTECSTSITNGICAVGGTNVFATLCGENLAAQTEFCIVGTTTIFDTRCASADGLTQTIAGTNNARREACGGNEGEVNRATDAQCVDTVLRVCGSETGQLNTPFHAACRRKNEDGTYVYQAYVVARAEACFVQGFSPPTGTCGTEDLGTHIKEYCATDAGNTNITHCPKKYAGANPVNIGDTADVATLTAKALNAEGTALLPTFIADGAANTATDDDGVSVEDGASNFIDGGATGLNLGDAVTENTDDAVTETLTDTRDGFAIATAGTADTRKYYVGILSGTDVGAPFTEASTLTFVLWSGRLRITTPNKGGVISTITFNVNVGKKTFKLAGGAFNISTKFPELKSIDIDGKFTANGLLYGGVVIKDKDDGLNDGTLTGLIGVRGAVGIFASDDDATTTYVGGFAVENGDYELVDCLATGTPFHSFCDNDVKLELCGGTLDVLNVAMGGGPTFLPAAVAGSPAACNAADLSGVICASSGTQANPFAPICSEDTATAIIPEFDQKTTQLDFVNNCDTGLSALDGATCSMEITDCLANLFGTGCDEPQYATVRNTFCTKTDIFDERCGEIATEVDIVDGTNMARDMVCAKYGTNAGGHSSCDTRPNVRMACDRNPFTKITADGITDLCTGTNAMDVNYSEARDACEVPATSFAENCNSQDNIGKVKTARDMACEESGIAAGMDIMAVNDCATRQNIIDACTTISPFTNKGCDTATHITPEIREAYCTNGTTDIFNPKCGLLTDTTDIINGTNEAREMACLNSQISMPIDDSCKTNVRVVMACTTDPFTKVGCGNVNTIVGIRRTFCTITDIFNPNCGDTDEHGPTNAARRDVCLADTGTPTDPSCRTNALAEDICEPDPFNEAKPGCANLDKNFQYRNAYCTMGLNIFSDNCGNDDKYGATNAARDTAIRGCITPDDTRLVEGICINAVNANPCIRTPFDSNCVDDFAPYYQDARTKRTTFCAGLTHNNHNLCVGAIAANPCFNNPFNLANGPTSCSSEFADRREVLINKCIVGAVGQSSDCNDVRAGIGGCLENPFQDSCEAADNFYFKDYADSGRAARVAFCDIDGEDIKVHAYCPAGPMFERDICTYNPYGSFCKDSSFDVGLNTTLQDQRTKKIIDCGDNTYKYPGSCVHVFAWATAATWALGEDGEDGRPFNTEPTAKNQFLRATSASKLDKGSSGASGTILNLTTATFDYKEIGGDTHDGVEFFQGVVDGSEYYYAGILGAANLGSPLSGATRTMYWNGQISSTRSIGTTDSKTSGTNSKDFTTSDAGGVIVATDFTLTINFDGSGGTVESFTKAFLDDSTSKYYYDIEGTFNERGLITSGTVAYAVFTDGDEDSRVADSITDATLSGIIGEDGALGVFQGADFAGGFVVHSTFKARVESADWELSFDTAPLITPTAENQFLQQGMRDGVDTSSTTITAGGGNAPMVENLILNQSFFDRINNQVFWFSGFIGSTQYHYAGISGLANLDATLTPATPSGTWYGSFGVGEHTTDFTLDIAFARRNGISGGTISAFVRESAGIYYLLEGYFDRAGVITGTVNYGAFTNGVRTDAAAGRTANGVLTGLIGQGGALGAFHSTALGADGYAGGFYAHPTTTAFGRVADYDDWVRSLEDFTPSDIDDVDYDDWERSFLFLADEPDTSTPQNQFLKTFNRIRTTGTTATQVGGTPTVRTLDLLNATNFDGGVLGGLAGNAVRWFSGYIGATEYHYAGVFDDADLGKPLTETPAGGEWRGVIGVGGVKTDFTLTITYGATGGTLSAFVRDTPNVYYLLDGGFDANGLIDGTVRYGAFTNRDKTAPVGNTVDGVLTGLIGADGALGVFHSTALGAAGYSGGFVARPNAPEYTVAVKYSDYRRSFLTLDAPDTTTPKNQFVTGGTGVVTAENGGTPATENTLALDEQTLDGVALGGTAANSLFWFDGFAGDNTTRTYYAGLNELADLGAPISGGDGTTADWRGVFGLGSAKTDFTLNITFTATGGLISAFVHELEDKHYLLDGEFDAHGLITGTVKYSEFTNRDKNTPAGTTVDGVLTGLIGVQGAIGAFYSSTTGPTGYSGGFVARDNVAAFDDATVRYETWARGFLLADTPDESKPRNQFLRAKADGTLDIADSNNSTIVNLNTATFNGAPIGGLAVNRYQSFDRTIGNKQRNYVGILPEGDLGVPVTETNTTELTWYGNFRGGDNGALTHTSDFILYLTIDGAVGTLSARVNHHDTNHYVLDGTFDAGGVITGTIAYQLDSFKGATPNGILTGLIGVNGAIGVFYSDDINSNYLGGFVAKPKTLTFTDSVGYADWVGRVNPNSIPKAGNQFVQTDNEMIRTSDTAFVSPPVQYTLNLNSTNFDGAPILGDINDGVVYFTGTIMDERTAAYAGIFDTTDLGAPLIQNNQTVQWRGVVGLSNKTKRATFTIEVNGTGGTISAFARNIIGANDVLIAGGFDEFGLIRGVVHYAEFAGNTQTSIATPNGTLSGIIGQEGAVAAFYGTDGSNVNYSGGFIASAGVRAQVNASAWRNQFTGDGLFALPENSVTSPGTPRQNQFLDGSVTDFADSPIVIGSEIFALGLGSKSGANEATYKSIPLGADNTGGIGYLYRTPLGGDRLHYAYLNHDSKIGTQIQDTEGTAEYHGQFRALAGGFNDNIDGTKDFITNTDFTLTVNFGRGTDRITASVPESGDTGRFYRLAGDYDKNGVITGTVKYGSFTGDTLNAGGRGGVFSGLIGQDNAVGAFISGVYDSSRVLSERGRLNGLNVPSGEFSYNVGFVGGFIAHRFAADNDTQNVRYTDWTQWFRPRVKADTLIPKNQFLTTFRGLSTQGTTTPTAITTVTLNDDGIYYDPLTIPGDAGDGFAYFTAGDYGYVGILDSTNLGAPVAMVNETAVWHGQINFRNARGNFVHEFAINIDYSTSKIDGFYANIANTDAVLNTANLASTVDFALDGDFNEHGLITGLTNFAQYTGDSVGGAIIDPASAQAGILTGIIGQEGAVGVFHGLSQNTYVGGFVVHPQVVDVADVNYSDWVRGKSYLTIPTQFPQFLRTTTNKDGESEISTAVLNALPGSATSEVIELNLNNAKFGLKNTVTRQNNDVEYTTTSGDRTTTTTFSYSSNIFESAEIGLDENDGFAYFNSDNSGYVGILDTTNLGKPLVKVTVPKATWLGQLGFLHLRDNSFHDFALTITFTDTGGKIKGSVADLTLRNSTVFSIKGEFDSQGVINGSTHFTLDSRKTNIGFLTGIIGQEGAVGVFQGGGAGYSGGFVVHPDVTDNVVYADWVQANPPQLTTKDDDGNPSGLTTTGANDFEGTVLTGAFDSPLSGNHFLTTKDGVIDVGTASSDRRKNNQIQQLDLSRPFGDPIFPQYPLIPAIPNYLRFDDPENPFTHDGTTINSKAKGGIAAFTGRYAGGGDIYTYAGILDNTDLGPVLMESVEAAWNGRYVHSDFWSLQSDNFSVERDFTLNVSFDGTNGKVWAFLTNIGNEAGAGNPVEAVDIYLEGKFGFDGVISGHTIFKQYTDDVYIENDLQRAIADVIHPSNASLTLDEKPTSIDTTDSTKKQRVNPELGILTGLIGQHGAVGVWHAITNADSGGGGFIVAPPASSDVESAVEHYAAWQASFDDTPAATITPAENRFLSDSDTVFDNLTTEPLGAGTTAPITTLNMETNTNNSVSFANGYFNNAGTTIRSFYALIGSNANLGATLPIWQNGQTASATWQGTFAAGRGDGTTTNTSFDLAVDFQNRAVEAFVPITPASITHYHLRGEFPVNLKGAIIGTVDHGNFTDSNRLLPIGDNNPGVFTGLIGTRGAIGAFISGTRTDNSSTLTGGTGDTGYAGGFVVNPPSP